MVTWSDASAVRVAVPAPALDEDPAVAVVLRDLAAPRQLAYDEIVVAGGGSRGGVVAGALRRRDGSLPGLPSSARPPRPAGEPGPWLSVIVPTLNEVANLEEALRIVRRPGVEVLVVDGGSTDDTVAAARRLADAVLVAERGRALQMNAGAAAARGEVLLFLHADTKLPADFPEPVAAALDDPRVVGGRFDVRLDAAGLVYAVVGHLMNVRSRWTRVATGDQAIFVRREVFRRIGGYPAIPLMEDIELSRRLKRVGRLACLRSTVTTSARRWQRHGPIRTILLMWTLRLLYYCGVSPHRLRRAYPDCG
jgi:rSAM/selenodomain-associated transferase 2